MGNFKRVLEIENKYNHTINLSKKKLEKKKEKFLEELKLKEEVIKNDYKKELENDLQRYIKELNKESNEMIFSSESEIKSIKNNADIEKSVEYLMEKIKNV